MENLPDIEKEFGHLRTIIAKCSEFNIQGYWSGSSYKYHPCGVIRGGIKLVDHWNVNDYRSIVIAENPNAEWSASYNDSLGNGPANPPPINSGEITVWNHGKWVKSGPWVDKIYALLKDLKSEIEVAQIEYDKNKAVARDKELKKEADEDARIVNNWK